MSFAPEKLALKIVFDTSSLIPVCLHPDREPANIFRQAVLNHTLYSSADAFAELQDVLGRSKFDAWRPLIERRAWAALYKSMVIMIEPGNAVHDCRDEKDNKFLSLAIAAEANIIVSSDVHLLELHPYKGIEILRLHEFKAVH